jgi:hypothetical protein
MLTLSGDAAGSRTLERLAVGAVRTGGAIIDGEKDHTVPWAIANAAYKRQRRNPAVTEIVKMPNRGRSLTIDHGWREVAQTALDFLNRFAAPSRDGPARPASGG